MSADAAVGAGERRLVAAEEVGERGLTLSYEASAAEREALAGRLDLLVLEALAATLRFEPATDAEGAIRVSGTIRAQLVQRCVVTLEPVPGVLHETVSVLFAPPPAETAEREVEVATEGEDAEPLAEEGIDAAALVAEHLALALDPYPRHPDAPTGPLSYAAGGSGEGNDAEGEDSAAGPFAALGQLKSKL